MFNKKLIIWIVIASAVGVIATTILSYYNSQIRLEHFSFEFVIIGTIINGLFLWALIVQIRQGRQNLQQAQIANEESKRARIDSRSISLVPTVEFDGLTFSREDKESFEVGENVQSYTIPKEHGTKLIFRVFGSVKNEGLVTAEVMTTGNVTFNKDHVESSDLVWKSGLFSSDDRILLAPGESRRFVWCDGHTLKEWLEANEHNHKEINFDENSSCKIQFRAWDFQHNVYEYIDIEVQGYPVQVEPEDKGKVYLSSSEVGYAVYPVQRLYGEAERTKYKSPYDYRRNKIADSA